MPSRAAYDVTAYGAKGAGPGGPDDTAAFVAALLAANAARGRLEIPPAYYNLSGPLPPVAPGVIVQGEGAPLQLFSGDSLAGTILACTGGVYDLFSLGSAAVGAKGCQIRDLAIVTNQAPGGWAIHGYNGNGRVLENVTIFQPTTVGQNGIWLQPTNGGAVIGDRLTSVSIMTGGQLGGTALKIGDNSANLEGNAVTSEQLNIIGYATGLNHDYGGGCTFDGTVVQSCTAGIRLNGAADEMSGGWVEANGTAVLFDSNSTSNKVHGMRSTGNTTEVVNNGVLNSCQLNGIWRLGPIQARAHRAAAYNTIANAVTKMPLDTVDFDSANGFSVANNQYTVPIAGTYIVTGEVNIGANSAGERVIAFIYKNGALVAQGSAVQSDGVAGMSSVVQDIVPCAAGDTLALYYYTTNADALGGLASPYTYLAIAALSGN